MRWKGCALSESVVTAECYARLGVRRVVNAADTYTALGGGRWSPGVAAAVTEASGHHVSLTELIGAAGSYLAEAIGVPAALPVAGAAAGLTACAAACMTHGDAALAANLPTRLPAAHEFLMLKSQRTGYDAAIELTGGRIRDIGKSDAPPSWDLAGEVDERTAAFIWLAGDEFERNAPSLEDMADAARRAGVPLIVDAAAQVPPFGNLRAYHDRGADLVVFSGGKGLRGPQGSGLVVGEAELVTACRLVAFPHQYVGRAAKVSKEMIIGLVTAIDEALATGAAQSWAGWEALLDAVEQAVPEGLTTYRVRRGRMGQDCPRLYIRWNHAGLSAADLADDFRQLAVPVEIGLDRPSASEIFVNPFSVLADEQAYLVSAVEDVLSRRFA